MEVRPGYKQTEVGVIPEDWEVVSVGQRLRRTPSYGINAPAISFDSQFPTYLRITDITEDGRYSEATKASVAHPAAASYLLEDGDIVFARTGASVGKSYLCNPRDGPLVFAGFLIRLSPDPERLVPAFLWFYSQSRSYWNWVKANSMRSGQPGINGREYASLPIALPPTKAEQEAIAEALSDADALIESLEQLIAKKRQVRQGAMQELLTGKKRLPGFSGEWETRKVCELGDVITGGTPSTKVPTYWGEEFPWVTPTDISGQKDIHATERQLTTEGLAASRVLPANTVLVTCIASIGKNAILRRSGACNQQINALVPTAANDVDFLYYLFEAAKQYLLANAGITATLIVSKREFSKLSFCVPNADEQMAIGDVLSDMDSEIVALEAKVAKAREVKEGMMQELLTGRIRLV